MSTEHREYQLPISKITVYEADAMNKILQADQFDPYIQDALFLIREVMYEGVANGSSPKKQTAMDQHDYILDQQPGIYEGTPFKDSFQAHWEQVEGSGRQPFLMVATENGVVTGVLEGRRYKNGISGEPTIFVNWVGTRKTGVNEDDTHSYRGPNKKEPVAKELYEQLEQMAQDHEIDLIIAGVNQLNEPSQRFHEKMGFSREEFVPEIGGYDKDGDPNGHATENGIYVPSYTHSEEYTGTNELGEAVVKTHSSTIEIYSKRIPRKEK